MAFKKGIVISDDQTPEVGPSEWKSIFLSLNSDKFEKIFCKNVLETQKAIKESFEEIRFLYLTNPIPNIKKTTYKFIKFLKKNDKYKHIEIFIRVPKEQKVNKNKWYDNFINEIKL
ncbi:MAG: hypothetical protein ACXAEX_17300 [Promethearchaeota archaeon]